MNKQIKLLFFILLLGCAISFPSSVVAGTYDQYATKYYQPTNLVGVSDLQVTLENEVNKVIAAGHLLPFRTILGKDTTHFHWYHAYDSVYTLSLAYPYVSSSTQTTIKTYLKSEMASYPLWSGTYISLTSGVMRQPDDLPAGLFASEGQAMYGQYATRPKLFSLYALWLYAHNTGDWTYINSNWSAITSFYNANRTETGKYYTSIAGAMGFYRMALEKTTPDTGSQTTALADINSGMTSGLNFQTFGQNAETAYQWMGMWSYIQSNFYLGYIFVDITPEIGKYISDNATLKGLVLGTSTPSSYSIDRLDSLYHFWYMAQAPFFSVVYGEDSGLPPEVKSMAFPIKAWVQKEPTATLRTYMDVPDALIGDYYYMQNLTRTIQSAGTECWVDLSLTGSQCVSSNPTSGPTVGPTVTLVPVRGDANGDRHVDGVDYVIWLNHYGQNVSGVAVGDFNNDGKVDGVDYVVWLNNYGL